MKKFITICSIIISCIALEASTTALPYNRLEACGLTFIIDSDPPSLQDGVFPYSDEADILLELASKAKKNRNQLFDLVIDPFCGDGKSGLPMLSHGIAEKLVGTDINPRAIWFAKENAKLNHLESRSCFLVCDIIKNGLFNSNITGNTLWIANPPFALKAKGAPLEIMRDGGENGLLLTLEFVSKALKLSKPGDVIIGIGYSRIKSDDTIEMEETFKELLKPYNAELKIELLENQKLWRGFNGKKEQDNPMPITEDTFIVKANPSNPLEINAYRLAARFHIKACYNQLGYYSYIIQILKKF